MPVRLPLVKNKIKKNCNIKDFVKLNLFFYEYEEKNNAEFNNIMLKVDIHLS